MKEGRSGSEVLRAPHRSEEAAAEEEEEASFHRTHNERHCGEKRAHGRTDGRWSGGEADGGGGGLGGSVKERNGSPWLRSADGRADSGEREEANAASQR